MIVESFQPLTTHLPRVDVLLVTVTDIETQALIDTFAEEFGHNFNTDCKDYSIEGTTYYDLGKMSDARTWLVRSEMGAGTPRGSQSTVSKAIRILRPAAIVMLGIAFGINPKKQRIGDVLVSEKIMLYDLQRRGTGPDGQPITHPRGDRSTASERLLDRFRHGSLRWSNERRAESEVTSPVQIEDVAQIRFGLILSGSALIDNQAFVQELLKFEPEAIGGEMEGAGLYVAARDQHVDWILVKGICDWADGNKARNKQQNQLRAARNAARFTLYVLKQGGFAQPDRHTSSPPSPLPKLRASPLPPRPKLLIGRDDDLRTLKARLRVDGAAAANVQVLTAVRGWPGVGKTTIAAAIVYDPELATLFPDGVLWASLGQQPSILSGLTSWGQALGLAQIKDVHSVEEASGLLRAALRDQRCLLIVDDVWEAKHAEAFRVGGQMCAMLMTTRRTDIAEAVASTADQIYRLDGLTPEKSLDLLRQLAPQVVAKHEAVCQELVVDLEGLPLAIQVAGRLLHAEHNRSFSVIDLLREIREGAKLINARPPADRPEVSRDTSATVGALLQTSTDLLDVHTRTCFAYLGVFAPKPATFDTDVMKHMWMVDDPRGEIRTLIDYGLLEPLENGRYWLHALLVSHAKLLLDNAGVSG